MCDRRYFFIIFVFPVYCFSIVQFSYCFCIFLKISTNKIHFRDVVSPSGEAENPSVSGLKCLLTSLCMGGR